MASEQQPPLDPSLPFDSPERIQYWSVKQVRQTFLDFFTLRHNHTFVPSSATIPHDDPTLLFANSGMTQFKPVFQGTIDPNAPFAKLTRAANSQKCIRAGGKHNDLEDVGKDVYHHTFFEMLGNWSFGDYFKREAIDMAWELLTVVYGIPKDRLYVTYFGGNEALGLKPDLEARQMWLDTGVQADRVIPYGMKENFWEMGEQGPCGPCSEIHFDRIGGRDAAHLVNQDDPDVLEIWNLVFMQYNREPDGSLRPLPNRHVDTGMGLERVTSVLQCKRSNYDTDVFMPIFGKIQEMTGAPAYQGRVGKALDVDGVDMAYRVVADHIRTLTFAISDGGCPSNEGRGYVLRRILRRAIRYSHEKLNAPAGFFASLADIVVERFGDAFPELRKNPEAVKEILIEEEMQFRKTLERGIQQFNRFARSARNGQISGADAWRLYDTFGFPVDLTRLMADEQGLKVDEEGYQLAQQQAKELSRAGRAGEQDALSRVVIDVHMLAEMERNLSIPKTIDTSKYDSPVVESTILAIVSCGSLRESIDTQQSLEKCGLVLDQTNFYAESGGQLYDCGSLTIDGQSEFAVEAVQAFGGYILHIGHIKYGEMHLGDRVMATFDETRRRPLRQNHTATHLLNFALKQVICPQGGDIEQRGSLVAPDKLRFDFNHKEPLSVEELKSVERIVNEKINMNGMVSTRVMPLAVAKRIHSLRAVFGEVYPDPVRVVSVGADLTVVEKDPENPKWSEASIELCGGTHVKRTGDIRSFVIISETAVAKGVRRIVAVTGEGAAEAARVEQDLQSRLSSAKDDAAIRALTKDLEGAACSAVKKDLLLKQLEQVRKGALVAEKAAQAEVVKRVVGELQPHLDSTSRFVVARVEAGSNIKALTAGLQELQSAGKSGLLYSVDPQSGRVYYQSMLASGVSSSAADWAKAFESALEGARSGGKVASAQGTAPIPPVPAVLSDAESLANQFATMKFH